LVIRYFTACAGKVMPSGKISIRVMAAGILHLEWPVEYGIPEDEFKVFHEQLRVWAFKTVK
jgi:hypothetical protein